MIEFPKSKQINLSCSIGFVAYIVVSMFFSHDPPSSNSGKIAQASFRAS